MIGTNVTNAANESVGEIKDVVLGKDGMVAAVIIGVGGFLGMGEREVAISYGGLKFARTFVSAGIWRAFTIFGGATSSDIRRRCLRDQRLLAT